MIEMAQERVQCVGLCEESNKITSKSDQHWQFVQSFTISVISRNCKFKLGDPKQNRPSTGILMHGP